MEKISGLERELVLEACFEVVEAYGGMSRDDIEEKLVGFAKRVYSEVDDITCSVEESILVMDFIARTMGQLRDLRIYELVEELSELMESYGCKSM